jgi:hypothetical protein
VSYQWQFDGSAIADATLNSYTVTNMQPANAGSYSVFISNSAGSVTSSNALLTVMMPPSISSGPANMVVGIGLNATFSVSATGSLPLAYQWEFNGTNLDGATVSSLTISNVQVANAGTYAVVVTNLYGIANSNALLTVQDPFIVSQPQNQTITEGTAASFGVSAVGTLPLRYQWLKQGLPLVDGGNISGAQTPSLTLSNVQAADVANYSVVVANASGIVTSSLASLTVAGPSISISQSAGAGVSINFLSQAGHNYELEYKNTLNDSAWTPLTPAVTGTGGIMVLQDTNAPVASRYYRLLRE